MSDENEARDDDDFLDDVEFAILLELALQTLEEVKVEVAGPQPRQVINPGGPAAAFRKAQSLLEGNERLFEELFRVPKPVFEALVRWLSRNTGLKSTRYQTIEQKVLVFLYIISQGCSQRAAAHFFGVAQSSVSAVIKVSLEAFRLLYLAYVTQPDDNFTCPETVSHSSLRPFYACVGAVDGTHIDAYVPEQGQRKWYNRKSVITQNVLCAVRLDGTFSYVLAGAEGSINDATLMRHARSKSFRIPQHRFYLGDAGFGAQAGLLTPYAGVRYHLKEWSACGDAPVNKEELYNLRHSRLRIIVELAFGRLKRKFRILRSSPPEYEIRSQVLIVYACAGLWNFIKAQNTSSEDLGITEEDSEDLELVREWANAHIDASDAVKLRDAIAERLWEQYKDQQNTLEAIESQLEEMEQALSIEIEG